MSSRFSLAYHSQSHPIPAARMSSAYLLVALATSITAIGVVVGSLFALPILTSGWIFLFFLLEMALVFTAPSWSRNAPLNIVLFCAFPFLSGLTITPFLLSVLAAYANGASILLNATIATALLTAAAAVFARSTTQNLSATSGRFLLQSLIGLIIFAILQIFIPGLRGSGFEIVASGIGIVTFSLFLALDMQRLAGSDRNNSSPLLLALSLYLDIFNLFLYVVRFMIAFSGNRR
jgi:modulator of FtsH protease